MTETVKDRLKESLLARKNDTELTSFSFKDSKIEAVGEDKVSMVIDGSDYSLSNSAFTQICNHLNIPTAYAKRIDKELFDYTFDHLGANNEGFGAALVVGDKIRAFTDPGRPYVPAYDVVATLEDTFDGDYDLKYVKLGDSKVSFSILPNEYQEAIDGSNLFGGLRVSYSDAWEVFPSLDAYIWRELCSNGMIDQLDGHKFRVNGKTEEQILEQISGFAALSLEKIPALFENFEKLLEEEVTDYKKIISRICVEHKLPTKVKDRLLYYAEDPNYLITISGQEITNMHDIVNLLTYVGTHDVEKTSDDNRERLLAIAGSLTLSHDDRCGSCGVIL